MDVLYSAAIMDIHFRNLKKKIKKKKKKKKKDILKSAHLRTS